VGPHTGRWWQGPARNVSSWCPNDFPMGFHHCVLQKSLLAALQTPVTGAWPPSFNCYPTNFQKCWLQSGKKGGLPGRLVGQAPPSHKPHGDASYLPAGATCVSMASLGLPGPYKFWGFFRDVPFVYCHDTSLCPSVQDRQGCPPLKKKCQELVYPINRTFI
jgi:hypothetical protein